jgi:Flp pilus assembly protein TadG
MMVSRKFITTGSRLGRAVLDLTSAIPSISLALPLRRDGGSVLILFSLALVLIGGMGALALDAGLGYVRWVQLQQAADAAVLAAITELPNDPGAATQIAIQYAALNNLTLDQAEIAIGPTWSANNTIRVTPRETVNFFFGPIIGIDSAQVGANTTAVVGSLAATNGLAPFGLVMPVGGFSFGQSYEIKLGSGSGGNGANNYRDNIVNGSSGSYAIGESVDMEPGNMVGPTITGLQQRIGGDLNYSWTDLVNPDGTLKGIDDDNPRILLIPIITEPVPGRSDVTITGFALFYVEGPPSDWNDGELNGTFINTVIEGQLGPLSSNPLIPRVTQLVE